MQDESRPPFEGETKRLFEQEALKLSKPVSVILTVILSLLISTGSLGQAAQEREADQSVKLGVELVVMDVQVLQKRPGAPLAI